MTNDLHTPHPLSLWMQGNTTIHFKTGHVLTKRMSRGTAERIRLMTENSQGSDHLQWADLDWMSFTAEEVLAVGWTGEEDLGWHLTPEERRAQKANGYPHGPIRALVDYWDGRTEPSYSTAAVAMLSSVMAEVGPLRFAELAEEVAGEEGAALMKRAYEQGPDGKPGNERGRAPSRRDGEPVTGAAREPDTDAPEADVSSSDEPANDEEHDADADPDPGQVASSDDQPRLAGPEVADPPGAGDQG